MFKRVLVGMDEQTGGRDAVALARRLVAAGGDLRFATVWADAPAREARRRPDLNAVDLLVLSSSRSGTSGQVLLQDETRRAISGSPCAVAVAPLGYAEECTPIREVGIAYDGSDESRAALSAGCELAAELGAEPTAFKALPWPVYDFAPAAWEDFNEDVHDREDAARDQIIRDTGVLALARCGEPAEELAQFSDTVDLLIVGSRGRGPFGRLVHGSTTNSLLALARSPLLILPRGACRMVAEPSAGNDARLATATL